MHESTTSTSLIRRAQADNPDAWERLAKLYGPLVYDWARRAGLQPDDAADVMQSVFCSITRNLAGFQRRTASDSFRGWLYAITRNQIRDHFRQRQRQANAFGGTDALQMIRELADSPAEPSSQESQVELNQLRRRALQLVQGEIEGRTWLAFWRTAVEGDSPHDVAADMGLTVWAVYKARSRVLQRLRDEFADLLD